MDVIVLPGLFSGKKLNTIFEEDFFLTLSKLMQSQEFLPQSETILGERERLWREGIERLPPR